METIEQMELRKLKENINFIDSPKFTEKTSKEVERITSSGERRRQAERLFNLLYSKTRPPRHPVYPFKQFLPQPNYRRNYGR